MLIVVSTAAISFTTSVGRHCWLMEREQELRLPLSFYIAYGSAVVGGNGQEDSLL
jgi:hypothetical protein